MLSKSRVKYIQSLHHKKFRDEEGCFIIEGPKITKEFLVQAPDEITGLYALEDWLNENKTLLAALDPSVIFQVEPYLLEKLSALSTANQAMAVIRKRKPQVETDITAGRLLMLDSIQDPGNFGTIIRIADWFGISNILCSHACADLYNPKVVQSTMGSILRINIVYTELANWCRSHPDIPVFAATLQGKSVYRFPPVAEGVILMGNESKGIHPELLSLAKEQITIPRQGMAESLNAAVATGIILSHLTPK